MRKRLNPENGLSFNISCAIPKRKSFQPKVIGVRYTLILEKRLPFNISCGIRQRKSFGARVVVAGLCSIRHLVG